MTKKNLKQIAKNIEALRTLFNAIIENLEFILYEVETDR